MDILSNLANPWVSCIGGAGAAALWVFIRTYRNARKAGADRLGAIKDAGRVVINGGGGPGPIPR
jgi:hypothetical protein